jgi:hypothetical protein
MKRIKNIPYLVEIITILGLIVYIAQSWYFANTLDSIGDEGSYLYKGYLFARGDYFPFQEYSFWTNKAPLSFLIPGYIQFWFGPGLGVGRYFAILVGVLMLVGVWITARRLGGKYWAAVAIWVFAISDANTAIYSEAVSQGLVACMMAWVLVFVLGKERPLWQLVTGSGLSVLVVMTRQNMAVVPPLLTAYIFWQHGRKAGWWSLITCAVLFIGFHVVYWPGIFQLWAPWLPRSLTPFLDYFRNVTTSSGVTFENIDAVSRLQSFATGIHDHFFVLCGAVSALILWPKRNSWKSNNQFGMGVLLATMFFTLFLMHTWASLPTSYCVYCFSAYHTFYSVVGLLLVVIVFSNPINDSVPRRFILMASMLFFISNLGIYYYKMWADWFLNNIQFPRVNRIFTDGELSFASMKNILTYIFDLPPEIQRRIAMAVAGVIIGLVLILLVWAVHRFFLQKTWWGRITLTNSLLACFLVFGTVFPAVMENNTSRCSMKYLPYYEKAGRSLADLVPPDSLVYWRGSGRHLAFMLYMDDVRIFPPQMHAGGGYTAGNTDRLLKFGRFNEELDKQWRESADILIVWDEYMTEEFQEFFNQPMYEQVHFDMGGLAQCEDALLVFRRIP